MADIFISYVREDFDQAEKFANALSSLGWSVFWDRDLIAGSRFKSVLRNELEAAKAIVVLWSKLSVDSDWVNDEAELAKDRKVLVPVLIEDVKPPLGFGSFHTARLIGWKGATSAGDFQRLVIAIEALAPLHKEPAIAKEAERNSQETKAEGRKRLIQQVAAVIVAGILAVSGYFLFRRTVPSAPNPGRANQKTTTNQGAIANQETPKVPESAAAPAPSSPNTGTSKPGRHLVVLMMESRSFDHMLGFLKSTEQDIDGLTRNESNPDSLGHDVKVSDDAAFQGQLVPTPGSSFQDVTMQVFGVLARPDQTQISAPLMRGFIKSYSNRAGGNVKQSRVVMKAFAPKMLPVLTSLALNYAVADHWFSSVPGPTIPNYGFAHYATSFGAADMQLNASFELNRRYPSVYERLISQGRTAKVYYYDQVSGPLGMALLMRDKPSLFAPYQQFLADCDKGSLPDYSFVEPNHVDHAGTAGREEISNDQHPDHSVQAGELFIASTYEALRRSPLWANVILVIVYSNGGGLYDHIVPPAVDSDGFRDSRTGFGFDALGIRVPAVIVSPFIRSGTVDHTVYDHTSLIATARKLFLGADWEKSFLTRRDQNAKTFDHLLTLKSPRTDVVSFDIK
jgi:phospholipase C